MATLVDTEFHARLNALGDKFAARLPASLQEIEAVMSLCNNEAATPDRLEKLHGLLHGLAGSGGTFGFAVLGRECRRLEQELRQVMGKPEEWPALAGQVEEFLRWAARDPKAEKNAP